jgi:hypothetical protein
MSVASTNWRGLVRAINLSQAALAASVLALAACSGTTSSTQALSSADSAVSAAQDVKAAAETAAAAAATASPNGAAIPPESKIIDSGGHVWTLAWGVPYENGADAGHAWDVTLLVYDNKIIYTENSLGIWHSWSGKAWKVSDAPANVAATPGYAKLSWHAPTKNTNGTPLTDFDGYTIYYGNFKSALTRTIKVADASATSYEVSKLRSGTYYFTIAADAKDGKQSAQSLMASKTIPVFVTPGITAIANQKTAVGAKVSLAAHGTDPDGNVLTYAAKDLPPGLSITADTGLITGKASKAGTYKVTVTTSNAALSASTSFTWTVESSAAAEGELAGQA